MPRNGDGSGDSGPYEGHEIVHGTSGDKTLQHTKHVAPMPDLEDGEALPGMNASGGAAAPLNDASEEYGATAPRNEQFGEEETSTSRSAASGSGNDRSGAVASSGSKTSTSGGQQISGKSSNDNRSGASASSEKISASSSQKTTKDSSSEGTSAHRSHGSHKEQGKHDLESISREKAERYVNLDEEDVQHAGASNKSNNGPERSSQRAPRDVGSKEDIEQLHGKSSSGMGNDKSEQRDNGKSGNYGHSDNQSHSNEKSSKHESGKQESRASGRQGGDGDSRGTGESGHGSHEEDPMRHNAAKFVNIDEET